MTSVTMSINIPKSDIGLVKRLSKRMGWSINEEREDGRLYDPETGGYLNDETMRAVRDAEAGRVFRCGSISELIDKV